MMKKKEKIKKEDCNICYGCGGCDEYNDRDELNDIYAACEYGDPVEGADKKNIGGKEAYEDEKKDKK